LSIHRTPATTGSHRGRNALVACAVGTVPVVRRECNIGVPVSKAIPLFGGRATTRRRPPVSFNGTSVGLDVHALSVLSMLSTKSVDRRADHRRDGRRVGPIPSTGWAACAESRRFPNDWACPSARCGGGATGSPSSAWTGWLTCRGRAGRGWSAMTGFLDAIHTSVHQLNVDIRVWINAWKDNPRPQVWTKIADQILESIGNYCPAN
jgi:hypothetical protein